MKRYGFTVKDNRRETTDYQMLFDVWKKRGLAITYLSAEYDLKGKLHYHGVIECPEQIRFPSRQLKQKGIHMFFVPIRSIKALEGWQEYCDKDQDSITEVPISEDVNPPKRKMF